MGRVTTRGFALLLNGPLARYFRTKPHRAWRFAAKNNPRSNPLQEPACTGGNLPPHSQRRPRHSTREAERLGARFDVRQSESGQIARSFTAGPDPPPEGAIFRPFRNGAEEGSRTHTPLRALDPESSASANSATSASGRRGRCTPAEPPASAISEHFATGGKSRFRRADHRLKPPFSATAWRGSSTAKRPDSCGADRSRTPYR
jgi:hypothetical protein